eukprot:COSAG03_NODE_2443_length_2759_cov_4.233459_4_plen_176_part_00
MKYVEMRCVSPSGCVTAVSAAKKRLGVANTARASSGARCIPVPARSSAILPRRPALLFALPDEPPASSGTRSRHGRFWSFARWRSTFGNTHLFVFRAGSKFHSATRGFCTCRVLELPGFGWCGFWHHRGFSIGASHVTAVSQSIGSQAVSVSLLHQQSARGPPGGASTLQSAISS